MPFVLIVTGLLMIVTGGLGTYAQFAAQLRKDFTGPGNFLYWIVAIMAVGSIGYIENLKSFSRLFLALILISMLLSNRGFFAQLDAAIKSGPVAPDAPQGNAPNASATTNNAPTTDAPYNPADTSFKNTMKKPGGGGFWDYFNIPNWARPEWATP